MKLLIAVPTMDTVPVEFLVSLANLLGKLKGDGMDCELRIENGTLVYYAREALARYAILKKFSNVLWLDSDMVFSPEIVEDLSFCGKPFVTGIAHSRRPPFSSCIFKEIHPGVQKWQGNDYPRSAFEIAACGMACVLMDVDILRDVSDKFGLMFMPTDTYGEDVAFCWRATRCGYKIFAEPSARVGHVGKRVIYPEDWMEDLVETKN